MYRWGRNSKYKIKIYDSDESTKQKQGNLLMSTQQDKQSTLELAWETSEEVS